MNETLFESVVCFGGEDWWYHNRGHIDIQLVKRFARLGTTLYVNSLVMHKASFNKNKAEGASFTQKLIRKSKSIFRGLCKTEAGFWVYSPISLPVYNIAWARWIDMSLLKCQIKRVSRKLKISKPIVWVACPVACDVALKMKKAKLVYQRTDKFEEFPGVNPEIIKEYDQKLKEYADLTVFVNSTLYEEESAQCKKSLYLDHGVDYDMFASAEKDQQLPDDMVDIPKPIVGFYGSFGRHTTDIGLLEKVVDLLPEMSFVFVGTPIPECNNLRARKNVWMLGQKPYKQIHHYGKCFDVALMPWKQNRWIEACNPIKLKEYLALGKPIVSTPFNELNKYLDVVYEAKTPDSYAKCIKQALAEDSPERKNARRAKIQKYSWDSKAQIVLNELFGNDHIVK